MRILLLAQDELLRLLSTKRGLIALFGFILIWLAILNFGILPAASLFVGASESGLLELVLSQFGSGKWDGWPSPELAVYWVTTLYLIPVFALISSADQTASDKSRGTLRYLLLRCSRLEIFIGRYLGQLVIMFLVVVVTLLSVLAIVAFYNPDNISAVLSKTPVVVVNLMLVLAPYVALMALVSVLARSARQATLYAIMLWVIVSLLVMYLRSKLGELPILDWILPGSQISQLLRLSDWDTMSFAIIPVVHTLVFLSIGAILMWRRDL